MDGQSMNLDGILQSVMQNPEMLKSAMELVGKLSANGGLSSLFGGESGQDDHKENYEKEAPDEAAWGERGRTEAHENKASLDKAILPAAKKGHDMARHRKLLEALALYVSEDKRDKFELIIRLLDLMDLAGGLGR